MTANSSGSRRNPIPPENRGALLALSPLVVTFGVYVMATGRLGKGPTPIEGGLAVAPGAVFAGPGGILSWPAWTARRRPEN